MSTSIKICLVFGYHFYDGLVGLNDVDLDQYPVGVTVDPEECMNGGTTGILVYATNSLIEVLRDRDGYVYDQGVIQLNKLPATDEFAKSLKDFFRNLPFPYSPTVEPGWILHTDVG